MWQLKRLKDLFVSFLGVLTIPSASGVTSHNSVAGLSFLAPTFHPTAAFLGSLLVC